MWPVMTNAISTGHIWLHHSFSPKEPLYFFFNSLQRNGLISMDLSGISEEVNAESAACRHIWMYTKLENWSVA